MEFLPTNLTSCIEHYGILPKEISYSILHDVALGLCYLHSQTPPIIHRDLSSNNVLLTSNMTGKISDLGVARILNLTPLQVSRMTNTPGTTASMPPEVMIANPRYDASIDEFSYGILMIHMFSGQWPEPQVGPSRIEDGQLIPVSEAERREVFLQAIGNEHPLLDLILRCINNDPKRRAHASEIVERVAAMTLQCPTSFANRLEMLRHIEHQEEEKVALREGKDAENLQNQQAISKLREEVLETSAEVERLNLVHSSEVETLKLQVKDLNSQNQLLTIEKKSEASQLRISIQKVSALDETIKSKNEQIKAQSRALEEKDSVVLGMREQLTRMGKYLTSKQLGIQAGVTWKQCADLPVGLSVRESAVSNGKVYCGGGSSTNDTDLYNVYCYDPSLDNWTTLPPLPVKWFGLGQVNGQLVAVGGEKKIDGSASEVVYTYERSKRWKRSIPPMPTARSFPGISSLESALVVGGGLTSMVAYTAVVEIFKPDTSLWYATDPLPTACRGISLALIGNTCYALGGFEYPTYLKQTFYTSVDDLLRNSVPAKQATPSGSGDTQSAWRSLPDTPTYGPTAAVLAGQLLTVGGKETPVGVADKKEVYVYSPSTNCNSWIYISDLPAPRSRVAVAVLSSADILVIGGWCGSGNVHTVCKGTLHIKP